MFLKRPSLALTFSALMALAFVLGALLTAFAGAEPDSTQARLGETAASAAERLQAGLAQRRREMEFLAAALPAKTEAAPDRAALRLFLRRAQELSPYYALIGLVGPDGRILVTSNGIAEGEDATGRDYFQRGRVGSYVGDAHPAYLLAKTLGAADAAPRLIDVATPVSDGEHVLGVLCAHVSSEWAQVIATTAARQGHARIEIRAAGGEVIASADGGTPDGGERASFQSETVPGIGDGGAGHWTVTASAPLSVTPGLAGYLASPLALMVFAGAAASAAVGWLVGRAISRSIEAQTQNVVFLTAGRIPELRDEPAPELCDLGAAVRIAAEELAAREPAR